LIDCQCVSPKDITTDKKQDVDKKRRSFTKAGLATPVIATLASRPVFGAQCLSQQLSGNMSQVGDGSCNLGKSRDYWLDPNLSTTPGGTFGNPNSTNNPPRTERIWNGSQGLIYGRILNTASLASNCGVTQTPVIWAQGARLSDIFPGSTNTFLRAVLCNGASNPDHPNSHLVAAYLNAQFVDDYVLSIDQVKGLQSGAIPVPAGYNNLTAFLASTFES
jgi:hypothetical protein